MSSQRPSFAKRDREMRLKDKARAKAERRAARKAEPRSGHGPPIAATNDAMDGQSGPADAGADSAPDGASSADSSES